MVVVVACYYIYLWYNLCQSNYMSSPFHYRSWFLHIPSAKEGLLENFKIPSGLLTKYLFIYNRMFTYFILKNNIIVFWKTVPNQLSLCTF